jgi:hypothetical protein
LQKLTNAQEWETLRQRWLLPLLYTMVPVLFQGQQGTIAPLVRAGLEAMDQLAPGPKEEKEPAASKAPSTNGLESALPSTNG